MGIKFDAGPVTIDIGLNDLMLISKIARLEVQLENLKAENKDLHSQLAACKAQSFKKKARKSS